MLILYGRFHCICLLPLLCHTAKRYRVPKESRGIPPQKVLPTTASKGGSEKAEGAMEVKSDAEIWIRLDQLEKEEKEWEEMEYRLREGREGQLARAPEDSSEEVEGLTKRKDAGFQTTGVTFSDKSKVLPASTQTQICNLEVENRYTTSASTVAATANRTSQGGDGRGGEDEEGEDSSPLTIKVTHTVPDAVQPPILTEQPVSQEVREHNSIPILKSSRSTLHAHNSHTDLLYSYRRRSPCSQVLGTSSQMVASH